MWERGRKLPAANGTNSESDRDSIQAEIEQRTTEIDRVSETTKFNETYLLKGDKDAAKVYTYKFKNVAANAAATVAATGGTATAGITDATTNIKAVFEFVSGADQDKQNELAKALKSQGFTATVSSVWDAGAATLAAKNVYNFELNGTAGKDYKIVGTSDTEFEIQDNGGNKIAGVTLSGVPGSGYTAATAGTPKGSSVSASMSAGDITAAKTQGQPAEYFDADGNKISANALDKYVAITSGTTPAVKVRVDAPDVYDAVGNRTTIDVTNTIDKTQDLVGSLQVSLHVGADATSENQITINLDAMSAKGLGVNGLRVDGKNIPMRCMRLKQSRKR